MSVPESTSRVPIYADRSTGEKFADAPSMVNAYLARFAKRAALLDAAGAPVVPTLDETHYAHVQRGSATIGINVLEARGVLMLFSPIMAVPITGREALYRRLLELSFLTTSDAAFAINASSDEVVVRVLRRLSALDYEEFEDLVTTVGDVSDHWDDPLIRDFGT
ncbi:MAG: YbjN domain-containing protein [Polyangiaceae bacterium]